MPRRYVQSWRKANAAAWGTEMVGRAKVRIRMRKTLSSMFWSGTSVRALATCSGMVEVVTGGEGPTGAAGIDGSSSSDTRIVDGIMSFLLSSVVR